VREKKAAEEAAKKTDATKDKVKEAMKAATSGNGATKQAGQPQQKSLL
jgi:hypothetical protein